MAYDISETWAVALEHYAGFGHFSDFAPLFAQQQLLFAVVDCKSSSASAEFGIGHGFTAGSDTLVMKLILSFDF